MLTMFCEERLSPVGYDGRVLIIGGTDSNGAVLSDAEWCDLSTLSCTTARDLKVLGRAHHTATAMTDGQIFVAGGVDGDGRELRDTELLAAGTHSLGRGHLTSARSRHRSKLMNDGSILIFGGSQKTMERVAATDVDGTLLTEYGEQKIRSEKVADGSWVEGSSPFSGETVATSSLIGLRFNRLIDAASCTHENVNLVGPRGAVDARLVLAEEGKLLFVSPTRELMTGSDYTLYIRDLSDAQGNKLPLFSLAFRTASTSAEEGVHDLRLPLPQRWRESAKAQPADIYAAQGEGLKRSWRAARQPLWGDDESWTPSESNLHGRWHRPKPQVDEVEPIEAPAGVTALSGRILRLNGKALAGVRVQIGDVEGTTNSKGQFLLVGLNANATVLEVDGSPADNGKNYGIYFIHTVLQHGKTVQVPYPIWLTKLDPQGTVRIPSPTTQETIISSPSIPGLSLRLPPGTVVHDSNGKVVKELNITPIPVNQPPFPLPDFYTPVYFTIQPGGCILEGVTANFRGARLIYPNYRGELVGARGAFWNYDAVDQGWYTYGLGTVQPPGTEVVPDPGVAIYELTGAMFNGSNAPPPPGPPPPACDSESGGGPGGGSAGPCGTPASTNPSSGSPSSSQSADPVSLATGQFTETINDLSARDVISVNMLRTYNSNDLNLRTFGVGMSSTYDIFLYSQNQYQQVDLILATGTRVHFVRISPGTDYQSAIFQTVAPGKWYGATISPGSGESWILKFRDGISWVFPWFQPLTKIIDRNGNTLKITRQTSGTSGPITRIDSQNGRWVSFTINANNLVSQIADNAGRTVIYGYDSNQRLHTVTDPNGGVTTYGYDANNRMRTATNADGNNVLTNTYDANGRVTLQQLADGSSFHFSYQLDANGQVVMTDVNDRAGIHRAVTFNSAGYIVQNVFGSGLTQHQNTTFSLDSNGNILSVTDPNGRLTAITYDTAGNMNSVTWLSGTPSALSEAITYGPFSQPTSVTNPNGETIRYFYDPLGNLTQITDPLNQNTILQHDSQGRVVGSTNALGQTTTYAYTGADPTSVTDPNGLVTRAFFDSAGHMTGMRSPSGQLFRFGWDVRDRLRSFTDPVGNTRSWTFNKTGNVLSVIDFRGKTVSYAYNALGQSTTRTDQLLRADTYTYDLTGRMSTFVDRKGQLSSFKYDALGRLAQLTFGATSANPNSFTSALTYAYDVDDRITSVTDSNGLVVSATYDGVDRVTSVVYPTGTVSYKYDRAGRTLNRNAAGQGNVTYGYDAAGNLLSVGLLTNSAQFTYDALNRRSTVTLPNGVKTTYGYDLVNRLTSLTYQKGSTTLGNLTYGYDGSGQVTNVGGSFARVTLPAATGPAVYDDAGEITSNNGNTLTYDLNGNLKSGNGNTYTWDARNQLVSVARIGWSAQYQYFPTGQRYSRNMNGTITKYLYDDMSFIQEQNATGAVVANIVNTGLDETLWRATTSSTHSYLSDRLVSRLAETDATGAANANYTYTPYGSLSRTGTSDQSTQAFIGREDEGSGLLYLRGRYYDPSLGRFLREDPAGFSGGINLYGYALENPMLGTDPLGLHYCPTPPPAPPGFDYRANVQTTQNIAMFMSVPAAWMFLAWKMHHGGGWDVGTLQGNHDAGNFNYGATTSAAGVPPSIAYWWAGFFQQYMSGPDSKASGVGHPLDSDGPRGDEPGDYEFDQAGRAWNQCNCK